MSPAILCRFGFLVVVGMLQLACATGPAVTTDMDSSVDFSQFRTYRVLDSDARSADEDDGAVIERQVIAAIERELRARGYTVAAEPDLLVNFDLSIEQRVSVTDTPRTIRHPYMLGFHTSWEQRVEEFDEGTLVIDLADAKRLQLVWRGSTQKVVSRAMRDNREGAINAAVAAIFAEFPFRAGG